MGVMFSIKSYFSSASRGKRVYLDYASATPVVPEALRAFDRASRLYANPGGIHTDAVAAKKLLQNARERIAAHLACKPREIIFTSGLTEGNALAILGAARAMERVRRTLQNTHWIVSSIEHSSVLECFSEIERIGATVSHIEPDMNGIIGADKIAEALRPETVFVSVGWTNNEIGSVQPLAAISRVIREHEKTRHTNILLHSDAGQGPLYLSAQVHTLGVDLFALGSGKLYGPRGAGCLYAGNKAQLFPLYGGGGQERGLRSGTEDVALACAFAEALDVIAAERHSESRRLENLRDKLAHGLAVQIPGLLLNGAAKTALPHMLNVSVPGEKNGEYLALQLDRAGVSLSTKSACREGESDSHVVTALGGPGWRAKNTLRFSLGRGTTEGDVVRALNALTVLLSKKDAI